MKIKIINVVGTRPNFMKIASLMAQMRKDVRFEIVLVHTGQHYDNELSKFFFKDLGLPEPHIYLGVGSGGHGEQTGKIMIEFEKVLVKERPDLVVVVGDVNSTIACGLVAVKMGVKLAHVEAGLRSFDREMPEEINRILTDQISDFLFVTEESGRQNLIREGIDKNKIHFVGNVMIDTLLSHMKHAQNSDILQRLKVQPSEFAVLTLHRPSNVDDRHNFLEILTGLGEIQKKIEIVFPIHPRTSKRISELGFQQMVQDLPKLRIVKPLGYLDFLKLMSSAKFVLTDSGGIQEETTVLNIPCLTLRKNTERPVTVEQGTNEIVGTDAQKLVAKSMKILAGQSKRGRRPDLWDGTAAERIVRLIAEQFFL